MNRDGMDDIQLKEERLCGICGMVYPHMGTDTMAHTECQIIREKRRYAMERSKFYLPRVLLLKWTSGNVQSG